MNETAALFDTEVSYMKKILNYKNGKLYQIIGGKASKGIKNILGEEVIQKSQKFTKKMLYAIDFIIKLSWR